MREFDADQRILSHPLAVGGGNDGGFGGGKHGQSPAPTPKLSLNQTPPIMAGRDRRAGAMNHLYYGDNLSVLRPIETTPVPGLPRDLN